MPAEVIHRLNARHTQGDAAIRPAAETGLRGVTHAVQRFSRRTERSLPRISGPSKSFRVAELAKSFARPTNPESLGDFRYGTALLE